MSAHRIMLLVNLLFLFCLFGCKANKEVIRSLKEAQHARIGVMTGTTGEIIAKAKLPEAKIKCFDDIMDAVAALMSGQLDGIVTAYPTALNVSKRNPNLTRLPDTLSDEDSSIALRKGNDKLLSEVNSIIDELKKNGTLADMKRRWFKEELGPYDEPDLPLPLSGPVLRIGVSATREPMNFVDKHGRVSGHDGELARRIAIQMHRPIEFLDMKFMALIPSLQSGKVDMIITGMTATDERRKSVDFSQTYFANAQVMLVRKDPSQIRHMSASTSGEQPNQQSQVNPTHTGFLQRIGESFNRNILYEKRYLLLWDGFKTTVVIAMLATILGSLLGALICLMRMSKKLVLQWPAKAYISLLRGMPVLVILMLIFYVVFASININPVLVAVIAFGMNFAAYVAEIYRSGIESIDRGQTEAGISLGFSRLGTFTHIVLPQTIRRILPVYKGEFISLVKMTSIVGYIAVQDLTKASDIIRSRTFDAFSPLVMVAILYFSISWLLMLSLGYIERLTDPRQRKTGRKRP